MYIERGMFRFTHSFANSDDSTISLEAVFGKPGKCGGLEVLRYGPQSVKNSRQQFQLTSSHQNLELWSLKKPHLHLQ